MTSSPPASPRRLPRQRPGDVKLHVRAVPYSPPRLASEGSAGASSRQFSNPATDGPSFSQSVRLLDVDQELPRNNIQGLESDDPGLEEPSSFNSSSAHETDPDARSLSSRTSSPQLGTSQRSKRVVDISINADKKTFSLLPQTQSMTSRDSIGSAHPSSTTPSSSYGRVSSSIAIFDGPASPLTPHVERRDSSYSPASSLAGSASWASRIQDGGISNKASDSKSESYGEDIASRATRNTSLPDLSEAAITDDLPQHDLHSQASFQTSASLESASASTVSDRTNYKVYGYSSPVRAAVARYELQGVSQSASLSSIHTNYQLHGHSSPLVATGTRHQPVDISPGNYSSPGGSNYQVLGGSSSSIPSEAESYQGARPATGNSDANYYIHGDPSVSFSSPVTGRGPRSEYSQESLVVAPLRPVKKRSFERSALIPSRSRESLRRGSLTSITNLLSQETARSILTGASSISVSKQHQPRAIPSTAGSSNNEMRVPHSHYWSAPLSTVASETEPGSGPPSRSLSPTSQRDRKSSGFNSIHSQLVLSHFFGEREGQHSAGHGRTGSLEWPSATYNRNGNRDPAGNLRLIRDYDENGDGLADLEDAGPRPRGRHASFVSNTSSERILHPSSSNRSLNAFSLPAWVKIYYGNSERRFVLAQASSDSMRSLYNGSMYNDSRANSSLGPPRRLNHSPSAEGLGFGTTVFNPRRRPLETPSGSKTTPQFPNGQFSGHGLRSVGSNSMMNVRRVVRQQTSSIWSPHLRRDRRQGTFSMWDPPSAVWSDEKGFDWRRNRQVVMFVVGFIMPLSWIVAAFLPLPAKPQSEVLEQKDGIAHDERNAAPRQFIRTIDDVRYSSARWWRNLNRGMSIFGALLIGTIIALAVVGVKQRWGQ